MKASSKEKAPVLLKQKKINRAFSFTSLKLTKFKWFNKENNENVWVVTAVAT